MIRILDRPLRDWIATGIQLIVFFCIVLLCCLLVREVRKDNGKTVVKKTKSVKSKSAPMFRVTTKKWLSCVSVVQMVMANSLLILLKELISTIGWLFWLVDNGQDSVDRSIMLPQNICFAVSLFMMQTLFVERLCVSLHNCMYDYSIYVYVWLRTMTVPILCFGIAEAYFDFVQHTYLLSVTMFFLCIVMIVNTLSVTYLMYHSLSQILQEIDLSKHKTLHVLIRLTIVSLTAIGSTTLMLISGMVAYQACTFCNGTYVFYCLYPIDSCINVSCLLFSLKFGEPYYMKVFGRLHNMWFSSFVETHKATEEIFPNLPAPISNVQSTTNP